MRFLISHRGNLTGPDSSAENSPAYVERAIDMGFDCEIDVRMHNGRLFLGHDTHQRECDEGWLNRMSEKVWVHCKDAESLAYFANHGRAFNYFWHENDDFAVTSRGYVLTAPGKRPIPNSISVAPEVNGDALDGRIGVCSDFIQRYAESGPKHAVRLLILDIDGVLTDGRKSYDRNHNVLSKSFLCKDFTAIKRFIASGVMVVMISGDNFNREMARKRNIDFYCTRDFDCGLDKSKFIPALEKKYQISTNEMAFVGDDFFDLSMFRSVKYSFATCDSPKIVKRHAWHVLRSRGGEGVVVEMYDHLVERNILFDADENSVLALDKAETTSREMGA